MKKLTESVKEIIKGKVIFDMAEQDGISIPDLMNILQANKDYREQFEKEFDYHCELEKEIIKSSDNETYTKLWRHIT